MPAPLRPSDATQTIGWALVSGMLALILNFGFLLTADAFGIVTARGGFQRLVKIGTGPMLDALGVASWWRATGLPDPNGVVFTVAFKVAVGLGMAVVYAIIEAKLPGRPIDKGLIYAAFVWLLNAAIVLPLLGEGFAGANSLTTLGIVTFAVAHTSFFVALALLFAQPRNELAHNRTVE